MAAGSCNFSLDSPIVPALHLFPIMEALDLGGCTNPKCGIGCGIFVPGPADVSPANTSDRDIHATVPTSDLESRTGDTSEDKSGDEASQSGAVPDNLAVDDLKSRQSTVGAEDDSTSTPAPNTGKGKPKQSTPAAHGDEGKKEGGAGGGGTQDGFDSDPEDFMDQDNDSWGGETPDWDPYPRAHQQLRRLMQNMTKPESPRDSPWWQATTMPHLQSFNEVLPLIVEIFDLADNNHISVDLCLDKLKKHVLIPLDSIRILAAFVPDPGTAYTDPQAGLEKFNTLFAVGPGGIATVIPAFDAVYRGLAILRGNRQLTMHARLIESEIGQMSSSLLACLLHLRAQVSRGLFDPKAGFRELFVLITSPAAARILPVGDATATMITEIEKLSLRWDSSLMLTRSLEAAFGNSSDPRKMLAAIVTQGEFGLEYFYRRVIVPFLDDVEREDYDEVYSILSKCCFALGRKVSSRLKTKPNEGARAPSPATSNSNAGPSTGRSTRARSTRNRKSGHRRQRNDSEMDEYFPWWHDIVSDSDDDLTNTDSMAGDEWWKAPKEGPNIKTRRSKRHPVDISSGSDAGPPKPKRRREPVDKSQPMLRSTPLRLRVAPSHDAKHHTRKIHVLARFPHPDVTRRNGAADLTRPSTSEQQQYRRLLNIYHPDKNVNQSAEWQEVTAIIAAALTAKFPRKK
ncbi:hypothetical protein C8R46DRAFT_1042366 [Mycena filopes]|nr:hypothetical protein C8R46DRAFT_1042366 [Mycena filopes]